MVSRRAGDRQPRVRVDAGLPEQPTGARIERIGIAVEVTEPQARCSRRVTRRPRLERRTGAYLGIGLEGPAHTAGLEIERVHRAVLTTDIDRAGTNRRLRARARRPGEGERPRKAQARHIRGGEPGAVGGHMAGTLERHPPTGERRRTGRIEGGSRGSATRHRGRGIDQGGTTQELGELAAFRGAQGGTLRLHHPRFQRGQDRSGADHLEFHRMGRPGDAALVTGGAVLLVERRRGSGGGRRHAPPDQGQQSDICQIAHGLESPRSFTTPTTTKPHRN